MCSKQYGAMKLWHLLHMHGKAILRIDTHIKCYIVHIVGPTKQWVSVRLFPSILFIYNILKSEAWAAQRAIIDFSSEFICVFDVRKNIFLHYVRKLVGRARRFSVHFNLMFRRSSVFFSFLNNFSIPSFCFWFFFSIRITANQIQFPN